MFSVLDIFAALILMFSLLRRLEAKRVRAEDQLHVNRDQLEAWRDRALRSCRLAALACALKVVLGQLWIASAITRLPNWATRVGGVLIDAGWVIALVVAWRVATEARAERARLGLRRSS